MKKLMLFLIAITLTLNLPIVATTCNLLIVTANAYNGEHIQGGCVIFADSYCSSNPGCNIILISDGNSGHVVVETPEGRYIDNMHTQVIRAMTLNEWLWEEYGLSGLKVIEIIYYDTDRNGSSMQYIRQHSML